MNANLDKSVAALEVLRDQSRTHINRQVAAMKTLSGLELTSLDEDARARVEFEGLRCNQITSQYAIESFDDYAKVSDDDAEQLVSCLIGMSHAVQDSSVETIMARLRHPRGLPVVEIETARRHQSLFTPILLQELHDEIERQRDCTDDDQQIDIDSLPFFAFLLMFEWDVAGAVPMILDSLHLPGEGPFNLYGDVIHEYVHRYLAHFLAEETDRIESLIRDPNVNEYVRWVASTAFVYLVRDEKMTAEHAIDRLVKLFYDCRVVDPDGGPAEEHCFEVCTGIVDALDRLGGTASEKLPNVDEVWRFVDESIVRRKSFYHDAPPREQLRSPTRMEDCLDEIKHWASFRREPEVKPHAPKPKERKMPSRSRAVPSKPTPTAQLLPSDKTRVGRNEQCPCNSGKKYKKCCGRMS